MVGDTNEIQQKKEVIFCRLTLDEKVRIRKLARKQRRSVNNYVINSALRGEKETFNLGDN